MSNPKAPPHVTRLRKDCRCRATASGPRIVIDGGKPYGEDPREHADARGNDSMDTVRLRCLRP